MNELELLSSLSIRSVTGCSINHNKTNSTTLSRKRTMWGIAVYKDGESVFSYENKSFICNEKNVVVLPKGSNYNAKVTREGQIFILNFDADKELNEPFQVALNDTSFITKNIQNIEYLRLSKGSFYHSRQLEKAYSIINFILKDKVYVPTKQHELIMVAVKYMIEHYSEDISNDDLAKLCGISTSYFRKIFTNIYNMSPMKYLIQVRLEVASDMLKNEKIKIDDLAHYVGFNDVFHFSKTFKGYFKLSPKEFSKSVK